jgi:NDP-sugar pyrophosphorylase family protein
MNCSTTMKKSNNVKNLVILAGGYGTRMEEVAQIIPKNLLPIYNKPLISHTLSLIDRTFCNAKIYISTREEYLNQLEIVAKNVIRKNNIHIVVNGKHNKSVMDAFYNLRRLVEVEEPFTLVLSDIFFIDNPFVYPIEDVTVDTLIGKECIDPLELAKGGILELNEYNKVAEIIKKPSTNISTGVRWSGMALCGHNFWNDFAEISRKCTLNTLSLEDIFQYRLNKYGKVNHIGEIDFININTPLHLLLANIHIAHQHIKSDTVNSTEKEFEHKLRHHILEQGYQI